MIFKPPKVVSFSTNIYYIDESQYYFGLAAEYKLKCQLAVYSEIYNLYMLDILHKNLANVHVRGISPYHAELSVSFKNIEDLDVYFSCLIESGFLQRNKELISNLETLCNY